MGGLKTGPCEKDLESKIGRMAISIKDNGRMIRSMGRVYLHMPMGMCIMVIGKTIKLMEWGHLHK